MSQQYVKLNPVRFGVALGLIWGLGWLLVSWMGWCFGFAVPLIRIWGSAYIGMAPTFWGGIVGGVWGFVDFFVFGLLVAWVYNIGGSKESS